MELFVNQLVGGLTLGAYYALIAVGLALVIGVARLVNFAHGEFFMLGGYALYYLVVGAGLPYLAAVPIVIVAIGAFGGVFHRVIYRPVEDRAWYVQLVATLAASFIIANLAIIYFNSTPVTISTPFINSVLQIGFVRLSYQRVIVLVVAIIVFVGLKLFIDRTAPGRAMRAVAQNREAALVYGINLERTTLLTFVLAGGLTGLAAALVAPLYLVFPAVGSLLTIKAFAIVIIGGMGNVSGALYGAFIVGLAEAFGAGYISAEYADAFAFLLMIVVLLWRPLGLFGRRVGL